MPFHDLSRDHLLPEEETAIDAAIMALEKALANKKRNLTPQERQRFGSVNESNKLFVNKVFDFSQTQQEMCSPDVDWAEFAADYRDRMFLETRLSRLRALLEIMENNKILHDFDNFQNALMDYAYTQYKKETDAPGFVNKYEALRQFFSRSGGSRKANEKGG